MQDSNRSALPIGFFDSGLGGLSVLKTALKILPNEDFIYYGDSANAPYGTKTPEEIRVLSFHAAEHLLQQGIKALVIACNTATGAAAKALRLAYPELIIVGIEPAIKPAALAAGNGSTVIVMATPLTLTQPKYQSLLHRFDQEARIISLPCRGLMEYVEKGSWTYDELAAYFDEYLKPVLTEDTSAIVLGCTHYPFLRPVLRQYLTGRDIRIIDGSLGTSERLKSRLEETGLLNTTPHERKLILQNSSSRPDIPELCRHLLEAPLE